jgi:DNA-binding Lrp family transcriptional regulator
VDERDCRLLIELTRAPFEPYEALGRRLDITGTAVKKRLDRLEAEGIWLGLACGPSPKALGREGRLVVWGAPAPRAGPRDLLAAPEVAWAASAYPTATVAMLYREDPKAPLPDELGRLAGRAPEAVVVPHDPREVAAREVLSPLDWRVVRAVAHEPRASVRALAEACGLSARVVRERRDAMFARGDLMAFPSVDATREEGAILYNAYVGAQDAEAIKGFRFGNAHRIVTHHDPPGTFLVGYVRTYAETHVAEERLRAMPGVRDVTFSVPQGTLVARERLEGWVDAEIARWEKARRGAHSALPSSTRR